MFAGMFDQIGNAVWRAVVMQAEQFAPIQADPMDIKEAAQAAGVLCGQNLGAGQGVERAQCYVSGGSNWYADKVDPRFQLGYLEIQTGPTSLYVYYRAYPTGRDMRLSSIARSSAMFAFFSSARKALSPVLLLLAAAVLAACDASMLGGLTGGGQRINARTPIPVALLVPRGGTETDNLLADNLENAARLAALDAQGVVIDLRVYATAGDPALAGAEAARAVSDGAKIIVGPLYAEAANAAGVAAARANVNVLAFSNNPTIAGGNVFVLGATFENTANRLVSFAKSQGRDRIVVVHARDVAGQQGRSAIQGAIVQNQAFLQGTIDYPLSQQGVVTAVPHIKNVVDSTGANAVFMTSPSSSALPLLTQLMPEQGIDPAMVKFIGLTRWDIPPQTLALPGLQDGWFALPDPIRSRAFEQRYQEAYGEAPHPLAGVAFDGIAAIAALAREGRSDALTSAGLTQAAGFEGANGVFRLKADGTIERGMAIATVRNQQVAIIDPAPQSFSAGPGS